METDLETVAHGKLHNKIYVVLYSSHTNAQFDKLLSHFI